MIRIVLSAVFTAGVFAVSAFGAWTARPGTVKVVVRDIRQNRSVIGPARAAAARQNAEIVAEAEGVVSLQVPRERWEHLREDLARDAESVEVHDDWDVIQFRTPIDVRVARPVLSNKAGRHAFVIQFATAPHPEWVEAIKATGLQIIAYVPSNAYVVVGEMTAVKALQANYPIQYAGDFEGRHKLSPELRDGIAEQNVVISIAKVPEADDARQMLRKMTVQEFQVLDAGDRELRKAKIRSAGLAQLLEAPAILWIEPAADVRVSGEREVFLSVGESLVMRSGSPVVLRPASPVSNIYRTWLTTKGVGNYAGSLTVGILDTGFDNGTNVAPHLDFRNGSTSSFVTLVDYTNNQTAPTSDCYGHGTAVAGVISGNAGSSYSTTVRDIGASYGDYNYLMGLGIAPAIPLVSGRIFNYNSNTNLFGLDAKPWTTIYDDLASRSVRITNNSWNSTTLGSYTSDAQLLDRLVRHVKSDDTGNAMAIYFSAGNLEGDETDARVQAPATAKNIVSVGGSESYNPIPSTVYPVRDAVSADSHADNGYDRWQKSRFGTNDSRLKPDVLAPATAVIAPRTTSTQVCAGVSPKPVGPTIDPAEPTNGRHLWSRGTSFASAGAVGNAALLHTWYQNKTGAAPSPAMLKAMQITFAETLPTVAKNPAPQQGFGKIDLTQAFKTDSRYAWFEQSSSRTFTSSGGFQPFPCLGCYYTIKDTSRPVVITLVWTDAAAQPNAASTLVNDLDLIVSSSAGGAFAYGNDISATTGRSNVRTSGTFYDRKNNVEKVVLNAADMGQFLTVTVMSNVVGADAINPWTGTTPRQDFALFIENVVGQ